MRRCLNVCLFLESHVSRFSIKKANFHALMTFGFLTFCWWSQIHESENKKLTLMHMLRPTNNDENIVKMVISL